MDTLTQFTCSHNSNKAQAGQTSNPGSEVQANRANDFDILLFLSSKGVYIVPQHGVRRGAYRDDDGRST